MFPIRKGLLLTLLLAPFCSSSAHASDHRLITDQVPTTTSGLISSVTGGSDTISFWAMRDRCYCCSVQSPLPSDRIRLQSILGPTLETVTSRPRGAAEPVLDTSGSTSAQSPRLCFSATESGIHTATILVGVGGNSSATNVLARCDETTLFGGFNTNVSKLNFLEVTSLQTNVIEIPSGEFTNLFVTLTDITSNSSQSFQSLVLGGRRFDFDIHSLVGNGKYGIVTMCHDGAPGSISARLSEYVVRTGASPAVEFVGANTFRPRTER